MNQAFTTKAINQIVTDEKFPARLTFYLLNLLAAILLVCVIGYFVLSHLESYTQHGQFIPVPAFNDLTVEEAHAVARHAHLTVVVTDSLYDDAAKPESCSNNHR